MVGQNTKKVKNLLRNTDKKEVLKLIANVNLTNRELYIIEKSELEGITIADIAESLFLSDDSISIIKRKAIKKIFDYAKMKNIVD